MRVVMTCQRVPLLGVCLAVLTTPALAAQGAPDCAAWNTGDYFEVATVEEVTAGLAAGADLEARDFLTNTPPHRAA